MIVAVQVFGRLNQQEQEAATQSLQQGSGSLARWRQGSPAHQHNLSRGSPSEHRGKTRHGVLVMSASAS